MKVMCKQCGNILDLIMSGAFAVDEGDQLTMCHLWSDEHMEEFARWKGMSLGKD